jgi:acyl carrier protein
MASEMPPPDQELSTLNRGEITDRCWTYCECQFAISRDDYSDAADFDKDFLADPLDHNDTITFVENEFGIDTTDDEMDAVLTFSDLVNLIERKLA